MTSHRAGLAGWPGHWAGRPACQEPGADPELFFPVGESSPALQQVAAAKAVCARCPVAADCLAWALRAAEPEGIWGGARWPNAACCAVHSPRLPSSMPWRNQ